VPLAPRVGRGEHATASAHVSERGLAGSLGTTTADTGDTSDGTTGTPRLGRGLVTGLGGDGVGLTTVLGHRLWEVSKWSKVILYPSIAPVRSSIPPRSFDPPIPSRCPFPLTYRPLSLSSPVTPS
jgi:hypothetical protein